MASFNKFNPFVENLGKGAFDLDGDTLKIALTNTAPVASQGTLDTGTNHPPPAATNGYSAGGATVANNAYSQSSGTASLTGDDVVFTATSGGIGPFRYAILYSDTAANNELIGWWDYGSSITLAENETFTVDFGASILTVT